MDKWYAIHTKPRKEFLACGSLASVAGVRTYLPTLQVEPVNQGELDIRLNKRWLGSRIKHQMGPVSIKMYDKLGIVLRIEVTVNDVSFFKQ